MLDAVSGIGPRSALAIVGLADVKTLQSAIASGNTAYLTRVSGVGKKTAQKIIIELKDKLSAFEPSPGERWEQDEQDVLDALEGLGYSLREARDALKGIPKKKATMNERLKEALKLLSR
jgi:Holliday junction DNA helicase RuvA